MSFNHEGRQLTEYTFNSRGSEVAGIEQFVAVAHVWNLKTCFPSSDTDVSASLVEFGVRVSKVWL